MDNHISAGFKAMLEAYTVSRSNGVGRLASAWEGVTALFKGYDVAIVPQVEKYMPTMDIGDRAKTGQSVGDRSINTEPIVTQRFLDRTDQSLVEIGDAVEPSHVDGYIQEQTSIEEAGRLAAFQDFSVAELEDSPRESDTEGILVSHKFFGLDKQPRRMSPSEIVQHIQHLEKLEDLVINLDKIAGASPYSKAKESDGFSSEELACIDWNFKGDKYQFPILKRDSQTFVQLQNGLKEWSQLNTELTVEARQNLQNLLSSSEGDINLVELKKVVPFSWKQINSEPRIYKKYLSSELTNTEAYREAKIRTEQKTPEQDHNPSSSVLKTQPAHNQKVDMQRLQDQLNVIEKIEQALIDAMKTLNKLGVQEERELSTAQCNQIKNALVEWQEIETRTNLVPLRANLIKLFGQTEKPSLYQLRQIFPIKESGGFKEVELNGKKRNMAVSEYEGRISKELRSEIDKVRSMEDSSGYESDR